MMKKRFILPALLAFVCIFSFAITPPTRAESTRPEVTASMPDTQLYKWESWIENGQTEWRFYWEDEPITGLHRLAWNGKSDYYYFSEYGNRAGIMQRGWQQITTDSGTHWYYFDQGGRMLTGWHMLYRDGGTHWFYFKTEGPSASISGDSSYANPVGSMLTGWQKIYFDDRDRWFFFENNGRMATGWKKYGAHWYYLEHRGTMATGWKALRYNNRNCWFFFENNGTMATGWKYLDYGGKKNWYWFTPKGDMARGAHIIGSKTYRFDSGGRWLP